MPRVPIRVEPYGFWWVAVMDGAFVGPAYIAMPHRQRHGFTREQAMRRLERCLRYEWQAYLDKSARTTRHEIG